MDAKQTSLKFALPRAANPIDAMLPVVLGEARRRMLLLVCIAAAVALFALVVGLLWPKKYEATTTILVQETSIITPLMRGVATPTGTKDRADIARDVIFSSKVMHEILATGGWLASHPSAIQQERIIDGIKARTQIKFTHGNLISISYYDSNARRAYDVTREFAKLFISESLASKQRESRNAYEFIDSQVGLYRRKLTEVENNLKDFRVAHPDTSPGSGAATTARISALRSDIENASIKLSEEQSQAASLRAQLSGESEVTAVQTAQGVYQAQIAELQAHLDKLLLTYTNDYPDVVSTRHKIEDLRQLLAQAQNAKLTQHEDRTTPTALGPVVRFNPLYQDIKNQLSVLQGSIAATHARIAASEQLLQTEVDRSKRIASVDNATAELARNYQVDQTIYQDLLTRRQNAHISMNLDEAHQGLSFKIQNPAVLPLTPSGLRFIHFGLAGIFLAFAIPIGLLFGIARFDPRVRSIEQLELAAGQPVLAVVPFYPTLQDQRRQRLERILAVAIILLVVIAYAIVVWLRHEGIA